MCAQRNTMPLQGRVLMYCATHYIISPWFTAAWHWGGARRKTYDKRHGVHSHACPKRLPPNPEAPPKPSPALRATLRSPRPHPRLLVLLSLSPLENIHGALLARAAFVRGPRVCPAAAPSPIPAAGTTHCGATGSSFTLICLRVLLISSPMPGPLRMRTQTEILLTTVTSASFWSHFALSNGDKQMTLAPTTMHVAETSGAGLPALSAAGPCWPNDKAPWRRRPGRRRPWRLLHCGNRSLTDARARALSSPWATASFPEPTAIAAPSAPRGHSSAPKRL